MRKLFVSPIAVVAVFGLSACDIDAGSKPAPTYVRRGPVPLPTPTHEQLVEQQRNERRCFAYKHATGPFASENYDRCLSTPEMRSPTRSSRSEPSLTDQVADLTDQISDLTEQIDDLDR